MQSGMSLIEVLVALFILAMTWPDIVMDTTGIVTARDLVIRDGAGEYRLAVESDGAVSVER
jgi:prepilin-type N-terminal cleavage/methylation domain-containing protein